MKYHILIICFLTAAISADAQDEKTMKAIVAEGKLLYRTEMASWYGTDIFLEKFPEKKSSFGGYFSYPAGDRTNCVFYSRDSIPTALVTISFDNTFSLSSAVTSSDERKFSDDEKRLYKLRAAAVPIINSDTLFSSYENTSLNVIPVFSENQLKVFVLTGPQKQGVVIIGNDYLLTFDDKFNLLTKKKLHVSMLPLEYGDKQIIGAMHSHLPQTGAYITSTDICTLMLYAKFAGWKQHYVLSDEYVSIWDCEKNDLTVMTRKAWDKISNHQKEKSSQ